MSGHEHVTVGQVKVRQQTVRTLRRVSHICRISELGRLVHLIGYPAHKCSLSTGDQRGFDVIVVLVSSIVSVFKAVFAFCSTLLHCRGFQT